MKGIVLAGGFGTRLHPSTISVSKQLLPIYDKPLVYYPLSTLMSSGITEILIVTSEVDIALFKKLFGDGSRLGINITYESQTHPNGIAEAFLIGEEFIGKDEVTLILGDNIFIGNKVSSQIFQDTKTSFIGNKIFAYQVPDPGRYGVVEFDDKFKAISIEEKPKDPKSHYAVTGLYLYDNKVVDIAKSLEPSARGELEITDINRVYLEDNSMEVCLLDAEETWLDAGTPESMLEASHFVQTIQKRRSCQIGCPEEIALIKGYISKQEFMELARLSPKNSYGDYLRSLEFKD
jgi:glucose-1-phosphate thymidylyltransferase|tara:strand:+ start:632 stop:1504 length:873 start_codon:yes stop_codon:yes gene_type:complete